MMYICIFLELLFLFVINKWQENNKLLIDERIVWFFNGLFLTSIIYTIAINIIINNLIFEIEYLKFLIEKTSLIF